MVQHVILFDAYGQPVAVTYDGAKYYIEIHGLDGTVITASTNKIDSAATDGLTGVEDSLAYRIHEIERHFHSYERWFETAATPNGEIHVADRIGSGGGAFQVDAGNDDWGAWVQILGSSDTPADAGKVEFDLHRISIVNAERNADYFVQIAFGASGAAALLVNTYTEEPFKPASNQVDSSAVYTQSKRQAAGTKTWVRTKCPGQDTGTLSFYHGIHEYEG